MLSGEKVENKDESNIGPVRFELVSKKPSAFGASTLDSMIPSTDEDDNLLRQRQRDLLLLQEDLLTASATNDNTNQNTNSNPDEDDYDDLLNHDIATQMAVKKRKLHEGSVTINSAAFANSGLDSSLQAKVLAQAQAIAAKLAASNQQQPLPSNQIQASQQPTAPLTKEEEDKIKLKKLVEQIPADK